MNAETLALDPGVETSLNGEKPAQPGRGKRMVIIDPSLNSPHSHNLDYAKVFIRDARNLGFEVILLANRGFGHGAIEGCTVRSVFNHTIYEHGEIVRTQSNPKWLQVSRIVARMRNSLGFRIGALEENRRNSGRQIEAEYIKGFKSFVSFLSLLGGGLLVAGARLLMREKTPFNRDAFAIALAAEIKRLNLGAGDLVVFHTASFGLLESLSEVRLQLPKLVACDADAHFIFHMSPTAPDARTYLNRYYQFADPRTLKSRLRVGSPFVRNHFWATSDALRSEIEPLTGIDFRLWEHITDISPEEVLATRERVTQRVQDAEIRVGIRGADVREDLIEPLSDCFIKSGRPARLVILSRGPMVRGAAALLKARVPNAEVLDASGDNAFLEAIASCDTFILPYERESYRRRISAMLGDCAMLGVAVVAQKDTTLGHHHAYTDVFSYSELEDLPKAVAAAIAARAGRVASGQPRWPAPKRASAAYFRHVGDQLLDASQHGDAFEALKKVKVAVTVAPLWGRCGSTRAFEAQFQVLNLLGYFVIQTFLNRERDSGVSSIPHYFNMLRENSMGGRANVQRIALRSSFASLVALLRPRFWKSSAMGQLAELHATASVRDPVAMKVMAQADLGIINHVYHLQFGHRRIGGRKVLDTHDVQSVHMQKNGAANFLTRRPDSFDALFADEAALVGTANYIVNVSEDDDRVLREHNPNSTHIYPWVPPLTLTPTYATPAEWAAACDKGPWYEGFGHFDLFLAGDAHPANIVSALWFMREVYLPYLQPKGLRLIICGRLSNAVYAELGGVEHVFYAAFVPDIDDVRALSRIAILPDRAGAGISNKTIEAMSRGMAFSSTSFAMRGIESNYSKGVPVFDDPKSMAADIISLSRYSRKRAEREALSVAIYTELFSLEPILEKWKIALDVPR